MGLDLIGKRSRYIVRMQEMQKKTPIQLHAAKKASNATIKETDMFFVLDLIVFFFNPKTC